MATSRKPNPVKPKVQVVEDHLHYVTRAGSEAIVPLNLTRKQYKAFSAVDDNANMDALFDLLAALGVPEDSVGVLDVLPLYEAWANELTEALGGEDAGESESSSA